MTYRVSLRTSLLFLMGRFRLATLTMTLIALVAAADAAAQQPMPAAPPYSEKTLQDLATLQAAALRSDYALKQTAYLCNNIGPRFSGTPQERRAIEYVAEEMRKLGLEVTLQQVVVPRWQRGIEEGALVEFSGMAEGTTQRIVLTTLGGSIATPPDGVTAEVIAVADFDELNSLGRERVAGKIVLLNNAFDARMAESGYGRQAFGRGVVPRYRSAVEAAKHGAVAVLVRSVGSSRSRLAHAGTITYQNAAQKIPAAAISNEDADLIAYLLESGRVRIKLLLTPQTFPDVTSYNVIADLKGTEQPEQIVVVTGHLDSWDLGTGALDDAVGVAVSMQVPYLMKQLGLTAKRTIRFIAHVNEENGVAGANTYAREADIANHFASIESDLGASHPVGFLFAGNPDALPLLAPLSRILSAQGAGLVEHQPRGGGVGALGGNLNRKGVPAFAPWFDTRTFFKYHHTAADTFDKVNPQELAESGAVMAVLAYGLANLEQPIPR